MSNVNHPKHYGGQDNAYEAIKVIEAWDLDFCLGNVVKYVSRAGKKHPNKELEDLEKAQWYLERRISQLKEGLDNDKNIHIKRLKSVIEKKRTGSRPLQPTYWTPFGVITGELEQMIKEEE